MRAPEFQNAHTPKDALNPRRVLCTFIFLKSLTDFHGNPEGLRALRAPKNSYPRRIFWESLGIPFPFPRRIFLGALCASDSRKSGAHIPPFKLSQKSMEYGGQNPGGL